MKKLFTIRFFSFIIMLALMATVSSCTKAKIEVAVKAANMSCPIYVEGVGKVTSITYDDNTVYYNCLVNEDIDIKTIKSNSDVMKTITLNDLIEDGDSDIREFLDIIMAANADIVYKYTDKRDNSAEILIHSYEIKDALESSGRSRRSNEIDAMVALANANAEDGVTCHREGDNIVFTYNLEPSISLQDITDNKGEIKENILAVIEPDTDPIIELCADNDLDIIYRYKTSDGRSIDITIYSYEIKARL